MSEPPAKKAKPSVDERADLLKKLAQHFAKPGKVEKAYKAFTNVLNAAPPVLKKDVAQEFAAVLRAAYEAGVNEGPASRREACLNAWREAAQWRHVVPAEERDEFDSWCLAAVTGNELFTDDSFTFAAPMARVREALKEASEAQAKARIARIEGQDNVADVPEHRIEALFACLKAALANAEAQGKRAAWARAATAPLLRQASECQAASGLFGEERGRSVGEMAREAGQGDYERVKRKASAVDRSFDNSYEQGIKRWTSTLDQVAKQCDPGAEGKKQQ